MVRSRTRHTKSRTVVVSYRHNSVGLAPVSFTPSSIPWRYVDPGEAKYANLRYMYVMVVTMHVHPSLDLQSIKLAPYPVIRNLFLILK